MVVSESAGVAIESLGFPFSTNRTPLESVTAHERVNTLAHESADFSPVSIVLGFATMITAGTGVDDKS